MSWPDRRKARCYSTPPFKPNKPLREERTFSNGKIHDFQIKDHYFWTDAAPAYTTSEDRAAKAKPAPKPTEKPTYRSGTVREAAVA